MRERETGEHTIISRDGRVETCQRARCPPHAPPARKLRTSEERLVNRLSTHDTGLQLQNFYTLQLRLCRDGRQKSTQSHLLRSRVEADAVCRVCSIGAGLGLAGAQRSASCCFGSLGHSVPMSSWLFPSIYYEEILCKHLDWVRVGHMTLSAKTLSQLMWVQFYCGFCSGDRKGEKRRNNRCPSLIPDNATMRTQLPATIPVLSVWGTQNIIMQSISHLWAVFFPCLWRNGTEALGRIMLSWHFVMALIAGSFVLRNPMRSTQSESPCLPCCLLNMWDAELKRADLVKSFEQAGCWNSVVHKLSHFL